MRYLALIFIFFSFFEMAHAASAPPVRAFAGPGEVSLIALSPRGDRMAFYMHATDRALIIINGIDGGEPQSFEMSGVSPRLIRWVGDDHIIVVVERMERFGGRRGKAQNLPVFRTMAIDLQSGKSIPLLENSRKQLTMGRLARANRDLGRVVGVNHSAKTVLIPARTDLGSLDLMEVSVENGSIVQSHSGQSRTNRWAVDRHGKPVARSNVLQNPSRVTLEIKGGDGWNTAMEQGVDYHPLRLMGQAFDDSNIVVALELPGDENLKYYAVNSTGSAKTPLATLDGHDLGEPIHDPYSNLVVGVNYIKDKTETIFFDPQLQAAFTKLERSFGGKSLKITSWSKDRTAFIVAMNPPGEPDSYFLYRPANNKFSLISHARPSLIKGAMGQVEPFPYTSRNGTALRAYLTLPTDKKSNLPLVVVLPDGTTGRASQDYQWMAQMLAANGYAVLQTNYTGSLGLGRSFRTKGQGKWGSTIRHDIDDGVKALIDRGIVNGKKICVFGTGAGGLAALLGAAAPDNIYACAAAYAPLSNPKSYLESLRRRAGPPSRFLQNLEHTFLGPNGAANPDSISPGASNGPAITVPLLLIHPTDDGQIPVTQSRDLQRKLKSSNGDVTLIELDNSDHAMRLESSRIETGEALLGFLKKSGVK